MDQLSIKFTNIFYVFQDPPKFTQVWILGLKTNHLATLYIPIIGSVALSSNPFVNSSHVAFSVQHIDLQPVQANDTF
jgi:hypothetical protein